MKKRFWSLVLSALLILSLPLGALADMKVGSRGESVQYVQEMLIEMGFLSDKADGVYGKKTQAAVKKLQAYLGEKQTGILTETDEFNLYDLYSTATGMLADDGLGPDELMEIYPANCSWEGANEWGGIYCWRHLEEERVSKELERLNAPKKLTDLLENRLVELWTRDILAMYEEKAEDASGLEQMLLEKKQELFEETLESIQTMDEKIVWIELQGIDTCLSLYGGEGGDEDEEE